MMLALGMFVFMRQTLPHQTMQRDAEYLWPSNSRVGKRDSFQYLGPGEERITLAGVLYPELTGGKLTMTAIRLMADEGRARVDESLAALYGDIGEQANALIGKAGNMASSVAGMVGIS